MYLIREETAVSSHHELRTPEHMKETSYSPPRLRGGVRGGVIFSSHPPYVNFLRD
jgi:hypothetical protein